MVWILVKILLFINIFPTFSSDLIYSENSYSKNNILIDLISSEKPDLIYILNFDNIENSEKIIESLKSPIISIQNGLEINYLNFPRFNSTKSIKYYFNYNFIAIVFIKYFEENIIKSEIFINTIIRSKKNIVIIITDKGFNNTVNLLYIFYKYSFLNVLHFNIQNLQIFQSFKTFPKIELFSSAKFSKETISNVHLFRIKVACNRQFPLSYCYKSNGKIFGIGRFFHVFENFVKYLNGTLEITIEINKEFHSFANYEKFDFLTKIQVLTEKEFLKMFPLTSEIISNSLEKFDILLLVPRSGFLEHFLYVTRPFSTYLWLLCLGYIMCGSTIVSLAVFYIKKDNFFWTIFQQLLRSLLAQ